jgi:hypothetical protein
MPENYTAKESKQLCEDTAMIAKEMTESGCWARLHEKWEEELDYQNGIMRLASAAAKALMDSVAAGGLDDFFAMSKMLAVVIDEHAESFPPTEEWVAGCAVPQAERRLSKKYSSDMIAALEKRVADLEQGQRIDHAKLVKANIDHDENFIPEVYGIWEAQLDVTGEFQRVAIRSNEEESFGSDLTYFFGRMRKGPTRLGEIMVFGDAYILGEGSFNLS